MSVVKNFIGATIVLSTAYVIGAGFYGAEHDPTPVAPRDLSMLKRADVRAACAAENWDLETCRLIDARKVAVGMRLDAVKLALGEPKFASVSPTVSGGKLLTFVYGSRRVYLKQGVVIEVAQ